MLGVKQKSETYEALAPPPPDAAPDGLRRGAFCKLRLLQNPSGVFCKREVRIQKTGYRIIEHVDRERVTILNTEFWLLNTALAEPTKEVLQAPQLKSRVAQRGLA
jgi:hypothetical protein